MTALYNEIDAACCAVLDEQINRNVIAPGRVEPRSIKELNADDVAGYTQVHWFAGGGFWSVAARLAGWPDDRPVWTASCPCQPFSGAGKGAGFDDPRHLWPDLFRIVRAGRPPILVGEQVASAPGYNWLDRVFVDLEGEDYACRAVDIPACAVDAPHIRNRIYWIAVANAKPPRFYGQRSDAAISTTREVESAAHERQRFRADDWQYDVASALADAGSGGRDGRAQDALGRAVERDAAERFTCDMDNADIERRLQPSGSVASCGRRDSDADAGRIELAYAECERLALGSLATDKRGTLRREGATALTDHPGSFWRDSEWLQCHDGKARRTKPGLRLLVDGMAGRIPAWRIAGNSIVPILAAEVLKALKETLDEARPVRLTRGLFD